MENTIVTHNGKEQQAVSFVPELKGELAIVHLEVLKRLTALLPSVPFNAIKARMIEGLGNTENLEQMIGLMSEEIAFHESVNLITKYERPAEEVASSSFMSNNH